MALIEARNVTKIYPLTQSAFGGSSGEVRAVDDVSLTIERGETLGVVGESGSGKSTLGRMLLRLIEPSSGTVLFDGRDVVGARGSELRRMRRDMQIIFQDPFASLNPRMNVEQIVTEPFAIHGDASDTSRSRRERASELMRAVGLDESALRRYPHEFSGGQRQRIGIARALALRPKFIVADEPVSALDVSIQAQILNLLESLQDDFQLTYLFIAHDLAVVRHISDRIAVMYLGSIVEVSPAADLYANPLHPYTISLLSAVPIPDPAVERKRETILLQGDLPSPANPPHACRFHTRCPYVQPTRCRDEVPVLRELLPGQLVACHWAEQIRTGQLHPREREPIFEPPPPEPVLEPPPT
jgi:peptide/nickel transport system ATP-binding protein